ncbi:cytochrome P450 [Microtetraspora sp. NBRC 16547]|uniref:cytochrome P450 n=1 Tax=Microtetraspora sp. NBRC 16547 TaxID=3030993 RepID=UPI0024A437F3|nr:cytochrome P450 [Microtetraspora sp. NBRC 16547]GLW99276.1 cytochrome P450 [Microtetraspora sp. NBRC 16547]
MTETVETPTDSELPAFPLARGACPYQPPAGYAELHRQSPLSRVKLVDGKRAWVVTGYAEARALLADPRLSADRAHPDFPNSAKIMPGTGMPQPVPEGDALTFAQLDDPEHNAQRRLVIPSFTRGRAQAMRPKFQRIVDELIDGMLSDGSGADLVSAFAVPFPSLMMAELFGISAEDRPVYTEHVQYLATRPDMMIPAIYTLSGFYTELFERKRAEPGDDLATHMVTSADERPDEISLQQMLNTAMLVTVSGNESTMTMISLGMFAVLSEPGQADLLRDDPQGAAPRAVEELLRYISAGDIISRIAAEDIEVGGETIRAGEGVILATPAVNRDPAAFPEPHVLDLRREHKTHLTFGHGAHQCVAMNLATTALEVVFSTLFTRLPKLRLAVPAEEVPPGGLGVYRVAELPVTW